MKNSAIETVYAVFSEFNRKAYTRICLEALKDQTYKNFKIVVFDAGSTDGTIEMIEREYPSVDLVFGTSNMWWSAGMRAAVERVHEINKDRQALVLMLNNDTTFDKYTIEHLVKSCLLNNRSPVGSIGKSNISKKVLYNSHKIFNGKTRPRILDYILDKKSLSYDTDCLNGKGTIVPIEVFRKVGTFSKLFPHYAADWDFFYRVKKAGYRLAIDPQSVMYSLDDDKNLTERIMEKDRISRKEFIQLFFDRRSSFNMYSTLLQIIMYVPFPKKVIGIYKTFRVMYRVVIRKMIFICNEK